MKTDDLIRAMVADTLPAKPVGPVMLGTMVCIAVPVAVVALFVLGLNPEIEAMMTPSLMLLRQIFPLLLALGAAAVSLRLACPGADPGLWRLLLLAAPVVPVALALRELNRLPAADWGVATLGETSLSCLVSVSLIGLPLLAGALWALGRGASTHPTASGALAGLLAGGIAAAIYALHCTEASPLFYMTWYGLAIAGVTGLGALLGWRMLRW